MSFTTITKIETYDLYLDYAIKKAKKKVSIYRDSLKISSNLVKSKKIELRRIELIKDYLINVNKRIIQEFPSIDNLTEFYKELIKIEIGIVELKKALATLKWTNDKLLDFWKLYSKKIKNSVDLKGISQAKREFFGRISSLFKRNHEIFEFLDECRRIFITFPAIKDMFTVAIAGFPNVGKSTLLSKITSSKPKIKNYAFTTKSLLVGYYKDNKFKIQFIDTPGTLNREDKMNPIERMAYCAIKYSSDVVVFVIDPTDDLNKQFKLLRMIEKYNKDTIIYLSKTDLIDEKESREIIDKIKNKFNIDLVSEPSKLIEVIKEIILDYEDSGF